MKKLTLAALMACAGLVGTNAHAVGESADFNVIVNLASKCLINDKSADALTAITLNYESFQTGQLSGSTNFNLKCTDGLVYTLNFDNTTPRSALGLTYTLSHNATGTGTSTGEDVTITATIAGGQVGTCAGTTCTATNSHTLTVTY